MNYSLPDCLDQCLQAFSDWFPGFNLWPPLSRKAHFVFGWIPIWNSNVCALIGWMWDPVCVHVHSTMTWTVSISDRLTEKSMFFLSWLTARGSGTGSVCLITDTDSPVRMDWSTLRVVERMEVSLMSAGTLSPTVGKTRQNGPSAINDHTSSVILGGGNHARQNQTVMHPHYFSLHFMYWYTLSF